METNNLFKNPTDIKSYEEALKYLKRDDDTSKIATCYNAKALIATEKLIVIAEAWNKLDEFIPDFDNCNQLKWFPWFKKRGNAGFVYAYTYSAASYAASAFGSRLCFSTSERAEQFGKQFIQLWNDFLLQN